MTSGTYDKWSTPAGAFRRWHWSGDIECEVNGVWQSIPEPAQREILRLGQVVPDMAETAKMAGEMAEREACAKIVSDIRARNRDHDFLCACDEITAAIRARGQGGA